MCVCSVVSCRRRTTPAPLPDAGAPLTTTFVKRAAAPLTIDGEAEENDWKTATRTGAFKAKSGADARPFSEARFLHDGANLYLLLYAADQDIRINVKVHDGPIVALGDDAFTVRFDLANGERAFVDVSAGGVVSDAKQDAAGKLDASWESGAVVAVDRDGTPNDPRDEDEEWVVEAKIPLEKLGVKPGGRLPIAIDRCDTPKDGRRACGAFRSVLELAP